MTATRILTLLGISIISGLLAHAAKDAVLLSDVTVLTLQRGKMTSARRGSPIPQLKCLSGPCDEYEPATVQCRNVGSDGVDAQWKCEADMPKSYQFGTIQVSCEGYSFPEDAYVLAGSCGLEYSLELTREGRNQHKNMRYGHGGYGSSNMYTSDHDYEAHSSTWASPHRSSGSGGTWFMTIVVVLISYLLYRACMRADDRQNGGGGGWWSPPGDFPQGRPFAHNPAFDSSHPSYKGQSSAYTAGPQPGMHSNMHNSQQGPGFWSGALAGSALGYLFGSRNNTGQAGYYNNYGPRRTTAPFGGQSFTTGGTHTSAGFGGTRRR